MRGITHTHIHNTVKHTERDERRWEEILDDRMRGEEEERRKKRRGEEERVFSRPLQPPLMLLTVLCVCRGVFSRPLQPPLMLLTVLCVCRGVFSRPLQPPLMLLTVLCVCVGVYFLAPTHTQDSAPHSLCTVPLHSHKFHARVAHHNTRALLKTESSRNFRSRSTECSRTGGAEA
jgi:hypothetical protein